MPDYRITWEIDWPGDTPKAALESMVRDLFQGKWPSGIDHFVVTDGDGNDTAINYLEGKEAADHTGKAKPFSLTHQELATVLASLRIMQSCTADHIANMFHFDDCEPLDDDAIDELCERLNFDMPVEDEDDEAGDTGKECTCDDRSWYGDQHDSACDFAGEDRYDAE